MATVWNESNTRSHDTPQVNCVTFVTYYIFFKAQIKWTFIKRTKKISRGSLNMSVCSRAFCGRRFEPVVSLLSLYILVSIHNVNFFVRPSWNHEVYFAPLWVLYWMCDGTVVFLCWHCDGILWICVGMFLFLMLFYWYCWFYAGVVRAGIVYMRNLCRFCGVMVGFMVLLLVMCE